MLDYIRGACHGNRKLHILALPPETKAMLAEGKSNGKMQNTTVFGMQQEKKGPLRRCTSTATKVFSTPLKHTST